MSKSNYKRNEEKRKIIDDLNEEMKQIDFLNITSNGTFQYRLNYVAIKRMKNFIKDFSIIYGDLENFLKNIQYNEEASIWYGKNVYNFYVINEPYMITEEAKQRVEEYLNKLNFKNKLNEKFPEKGITNKREKI